MSPLKRQNGGAMAQNVVIKLRKNAFTERVSRLEHREKKKNETPHQ